MRRDCAMESVQGAEDARPGVLAAHEGRSVLEGEEGKVASGRKGGPVLVMEPDVQRASRREAHERRKQRKPPIDRLGLQDEVGVIRWVDQQ